MSVPPPPPRRRRLLRLGLLGGGGLLGLVLVVRSPWFSDWVARLAEGAASELLGEDVVIGGLRLEPGRRRLVVQGLVISHPSAVPDENGQAIVVAEQVAVDLGLRGWQPIARRITVDRPVVHLHLDEDGLREFRNIRKGPDTGEAPKAPAQAFPWDELWIRGGRFRLSKGDLVVDVNEIGLSPEGQEGRHRLEVGSLRVKVRDWTQEAQRVTASGIRFTPRGLEVQGLALDMPVARLSGGAAMAFGGPIHGALVVEARLPELTGLVPEHLRLEGLAGLTLQVDGSVGAPELTGDLRLTDTAIFRMREDGEVLLVALQGVDTGLHLKDGELKLLGLRSDWAGGHVEGLATLDLPSGGFSFELNGEDVSLGQIFVQTGVSSAPWVDLRLDTEIHAGGSLRPFFIAGSADVAARRLRVAGGDVERSPLLLDIKKLSAMLEMRIKDQRMFIAARQVDTGRSTLTAVADLDLSPRRHMDLDLDIGSVDLAELRPLADLDLVGRMSGAGKVSGPFEALGLSAMVAVQDFGLLGYAVADTVRSPLLAPNLRVLAFSDLDALLGETPWRGRAVVDLGATPTGLDMQLLVRDGRLSTWWPSRARCRGWRPRWTPRCRWAGRWTPWMARCTWGSRTSTSSASASMRAAAWR